MMEERVEIIVQGFMEDPIFVALCPDGKNRASFLRAFARSTLAYYPLDLGQSGKSVCISQPPAYQSSWFATLVRVLRLLAGGLPNISWKYWRPALSILLEMDQWQAEFIKDHFYISTLAVAHDQRGKGLGRAALEAAISNSELLYLETSNPVNLSLYKKFGFEVVHTVERSGLPPVWCLARGSK